jgi:hypothetical protein
LTFPRTLPHCFRNWHRQRKVGGESAVKVCGVRSGVRRSGVSDGKSAERIHAAARGGKEGRE